MNIKEIEALAAMPRANIRFYEKEGFLSPTRADNGYREYSESDLMILQKIKLFRQLDIPLDDVRRLQCGKAALPNVLQNRLDNCEMEAAHLETVRDICTRIRNDNVSYTSLHADTYLKWMEEHEVPFTESVYAEDKLPIASCPVRRFLARCLDLMLYRTIWMAVSIFFLRMLPDGGAARALLDLCVCTGLMLVLEPVLLWAFGTTVGKALFGLTVTAADGSGLRVADARRRTLAVFVYGMGCSVPPFNLWRFYKSFCDCRQGEELPWDSECCYTVREAFYPGYIGAGLLAAALFIAGWFSILQGLMPIHRGELSRQELIDNFNDLNAYLDIYEQYTLDDSGKLSDHSAENGVFIVNGMFEQGMPDIDIVENDGVVSSVGFEEEYTNTESVLYDWEGLINLLILSYAAADKSVSCMDIASGSYLLYNEQLLPFESFQYTLGKRKITCTIAYSGFESANNLLFPAEGKDNYFHLRFMISRVD